jgi:hypothetical protein
VANTTWNSADKTGTISLSNGALTATSVGSGSQSVRSTTSKSNGKVFFEVTLGTLTSDISVGVANATMSLTIGAGLGSDANGLGFYAKSPAQAIYLNGSALSNGSTASSAGEVVSIAWDITNKLMGVSWLRILGAAKRSQINQRVGHQFHAIVPRLFELKAQQQPLELVFPCKGPLHA